TRGRDRIDRARQARRSGVVADRRPRPLRHRRPGRGPRPRQHTSSRTAVDQRPRGGRPRRGPHRRRERRGTAGRGGRRGAGRQGGVKARDLRDMAADEVARDRADRTLVEGAAARGGGTWLFSEPQPHLHRLVDLSGLDWPAVTRHPDALEIAATCTVEQMAALSDEAEHTAAPLFRQCAEALLASWKIWKRATVGGNICLSFPAGAMISLATALDADAVIWTIDGGERRIPVADFVLGVASNALAPGEILRSIRIPLRVLNSRTVFRKIALSPLGRSGAVVIGRRDDDGSVTLSITASTVRPYL